MVHFILHPHGIAPTFLKLDSWSPGACFILFISTKGINQRKKGKLQEKSSVLYVQKDFIHFFKIWVPFLVGANSRLPNYMCCVIIYDMLNVNGIKSGITGIEGLYSNVWAIKNFFTIVPLEKKVWKCSSSLFFSMKELYFAIFCMLNNTVYTINWNFKIFQDFLDYFVFFSQIWYCMSKNELNNFEILYQNNRGRIPRGRIGLN